MARHWNPRRRRFLEVAAAAAAGGAMISCSGSRSPWRFLTPGEAEIAGAVCDRLIPNDEFQGALWAGAVRFIDLQLYGHFRQHRALYRQGLQALDRVSREAYTGPFATLPAASQVELLQAVEGGTAAAPHWPAAEQSRFFRTILTHTMESYYGDPRHGGNRDGVGYRSIGLSTTPTRGRSRHDIQQAPGPGTL
jgi:gluconate 2-dehydrogenase gamma chain